MQNIVQTGCWDRAHIAHKTQRTEWIMDHFHCLHSKWNFEHELTITKSKMPTESLEKKKTSIVHAQSFQMHSARYFVLIEKLFHSKKKPNKHVYRSSVDVYWFPDDEFFFFFFISNKRNSSLQSIHHNDWFAC